MTKSQPSALLDAPPRVSSCPTYSSSAGREAVELAASAGLTLDPWQQLVLERSLGERADGKWAAFEVGIVVPRQNGKGAVLEARELAGLFLLGEQLILHSAHEFKTAQEAFRRVLMLVESSDDLRKRVAKVRTSHGEEGIELIGGARLRFVARSTGSGRGFSGDCVILDEAYRLPAESLGALLPTLSARPNPQLWYASSAGHVDSLVLRGVRDRAIAGDDPSLCYLEWSADPSTELDDRDAWRQANPAMGLRISAEHVARELAAMPKAEFARERLGLWDEPAGVDQALDQSAWQACSDPNSTPADPVCFGIDVSPDGAASIAVAGSCGEGLTHVEIVEHRNGTSWVAARVAELVRQWRPTSVILDVGSSAGALLPELEKAQVETVKIAGRELAQACVAFAALVAEQRVRHMEQPDLSAAVGAARRRRLGELWAFGRRGSFTDISPLVAASLAAWGHAQAEERPPQIIDVWESE